nr:DUF4214 domain-containing protein [uncultured Halomonas sp.]
MATQANLNLTQQLYVAYYGRPADKEGLNYWADRIEAEGVGNVVSAFGNSSEFQEQYGDLENDALVENLYQQLFSRSADASGLEYYTGVLTRGEKSLAEIALTISNAAVGSDKTVLNTKIDAADYYTENVAQGNYNLQLAKQVLARIDASDTNGDLAAARDTIDTSINQASSDANLKALEAAQEKLTEAQTALTEKAAELGVNDANSNGSYVEDANTALANAQGALASARASGKSDAQLQKDVDTAKNTVNSDAAARATLNARNTAEAKLEADIAANGKTEVLADKLSDDLALYLNNNTNSDLDGLKTAVDGYLAEPQTVTEAQLLDAAKVAEAAIFTGTGTDKVSSLESGAAGDSIESLVTKLDERDDLAAALETAQTDLAAATGGQDLIDAEDALEARNDLKEAITEAEANLQAITQVENARDEAQTAVTDAQDALGFTINEVDGTTDDGSSGAVLFQYDADAAVKGDTDAIVSFGEDDLLNLLSENNYSLGKVTDIKDEDGNVTGNFLDGNNNAFEVFFQQNGANAEVLVETTAFGSTNGNTAVIELTGLNSEGLSFNNGVISYVDIA